MNKLLALTALLVAAPGAASEEPWSKWESLPVQKVTHVAAPAEWHRVRNAAHGVEFAAPCVPEEETIQEATRVVIAYSCESGDLMYIAAVAPLTEEERAPEVRAQWPAMFVGWTISGLRESARKSGREFNMTALTRLDYAGVPGLQLTFDASGASANLRVLAGEKVGVSLQIFSRSAVDAATADRYFNTLRVD